MVMQYFQYPLAAFELAAEIDRRRYGSRKSHTVRPETAKGAVADLYFLLDQSGGEVSYNPRFWGMRWEWNHTEVDRLLKRLVSSGLLTTRKKRDGSHCLTRQKIDVSKTVTKTSVECKQENSAALRQTSNIVPIKNSECKQDVTTVFSNNQVKEKTYSPADLITAAKGGRKKQLSPELTALFLALYTAYGDKRGRAEAAWAFTEIPGLSRELVTSRIIPAAKDYAAKRPALEAKGLTPKMLQFWITAMRWEDFDPTTAQASQGTTAAARTRAKYLQEQEA
jgi:hypothetical protein